MKSQHCNVRVLSPANSFVTPFACTLDLKAIKEFWPSVASGGDLTYFGWREKVNFDSGFFSKKPAVYNMLRGLNCEKLSQWR